MNTIVQICTRYGVALVGAWFATVVIATTIGTQIVLAELTALGVSIPLEDRLATTWHDFLALGIIPGEAFGFTYGMLLAIGLLIAFSVAGLVAMVVTRWLPKSRPIVFAVAGGVAIGTILLAAQQVFGVTLFSFARSTTGVLSQVLAAAIGGWIFARLSEPKGES